MASDRFEIDADNFADFAGFIREFNRVFVSQVGGQWNGNLDAFNGFSADVLALLLLRQLSKLKSGGWGRG
jgi:hypothetical protein